jgi:hypothetical protein
MHLSQIISGSNHFDIGVAGDEEEADEGFEEFGAG